MENCFETKTFFCSCGEIWSHWNNFRTLTSAFRKFHDDDDVVGFKIKQIKMFKTSRSLCCNFSASIILENVLCREAIISLASRGTFKQVVKLLPDVLLQKNLGPVWPDGEIKSSPIFTKVPQKGAKAVFYA